jgi:Cu/Ag efflux protein CusF
MRNRLSYFVAMAVLVTACADMSTPSTPSSSSATSAQNSPVPGRDNSSNNNPNPAPNQPGRAELKGIVTGLGGQCPSISFSVSGSPVMTSASTTFADGACSTIKNGDQVEVEGARQANNVVMADRVEKPDANDDDDDNPTAPGQVELKGVIAGLTGQCPSISFSIGGSPVTTSTATKFEDGACSTLKNGDQVEVNGVRQANNVVMADRVDKKNEDKGDDGNDDGDNHQGRDDGHNQGGEVELNGSIAGLGGACPSISFTLSGSTVSTSASTRFDDACGSLKNGDRVEVKGARQSSTQVSASRVEKKK